MNEQAKVFGNLKLRLSGNKPAKDRVESFNWQRRFNDSTCSFWLACLLLSNPTCFSPTYQLKSIEKINEKVLAISHEGMARLLYGCLFILPNTAVTLDWKAFLSVKNYFYQHQNITIIIKGEGETCPNFWNRHIILSLKFIWSCRFVFLVLNLIFLPSRFSLLSSGCSLCCLPHFAPTASRKKTSSQKYSSDNNLLLGSFHHKCGFQKGPLERNAKH